MATKLHERLACWLSDDNIFKIHAEEQVVLKVRKHWFILIQHAFTTILAGVIALIAAMFLLKVAPFSVAPAFVVFLLSIWLILIWIALMTIWTEYYLDMWVVTNERIVYTEQSSLFSRSVTTMQLERVQDATIKVSNIIQTLLDYGMLRIQTAATDNTDMEMYGIPHPEKLRQLVLQLVDQAMHRPHVRRTNDERVENNP